MTRNREWFMGAADTLLTIISGVTCRPFDHATKRADGECVLCSLVADELEQLLRGTRAAHGGRQEAPPVNDTARMKLLKLAADFDDSLGRCAIYGAADRAREHWHLLKFAIIDVAKKLEAGRSAAGAETPAETWWITLNGHGQIVGAYRTKEQAHENSNYVIGIQPSPAAPSASQPTTEHNGD